GTLDRGQCGDQPGVDADTRNREVLHRPLRLRPPLGGRGDPYLTHRVVLDPIFSRLLSHEPKANPWLEAVAWRTSPTEPQTCPARSHPLAITNIGGTLMRSSL